RLAHLFHATQVTVVAIAADANRDVEIHLGVFRVRLLLAQIPLNTGTAQHHTGHAPLLGQLRTDHADTDGALFPDAVVGEQVLVLIHLARKISGERFQIIQHRTFAPTVDA